MTAYANRFAAGHFIFHQLRHARVIVEMTDRQWDIDVAAFADGFAVVQRFHDRQQTRMFLHQTCNRIEHARTGCAILRPLGLRFAGSFHSTCDLISGAFGQPCKTLTRCGIIQRHVITQDAKCAVNKVTCNATTAFDPF